MSFENILGTAIFDPRALYEEVGFTGVPLVNYYMAIETSHS